MHIATVYPTTGHNLPDEMPPPSRRDAHRAGDERQQLGRRRQARERRDALDDGAGQDDGLGALDLARCPLKSISLRTSSKRAVVVMTLIVGTNGKLVIEPLPVEKRIMLQPAATWPASRPGTEQLTLAAVNDAAEATDEALMAAWAAGDAAAFAPLYARHRGRLYRFLLRQLRDPALADEFFQDVWQRVIAARAGWKPEAAFSTWLFRIAHNRLADHWRAAKHRPPAPEDADERAARVPDPDTPDRQLSEFEQRRRLQLALDELPEEQREVLLLRLEQELTLEEIGEIAGVGRETVKSRLRYAMDKLRARLNE